MKKLFVLALAGAMFAACNSGNGSSSADSTAVKTDTVGAAPTVDTVAAPVADSLKADSAALVADTAKAEKK
ncbi:MAG TPA: hypothetical protein VGC22_10840 [Chitinophaga sp.]